MVFSSKEAHIVLSKAAKVRQSIALYLICQAIQNSLFNLLWAYPPCFCHFVICVPVVICYEAGDGVCQDLADIIRLLLSNYDQKNNEMRKLHIIKYEIKLG